MTDRNASEDYSDEFEQVSGYFEPLGAWDGPLVEYDPGENDDGTIGGFVADERGDGDEVRSEQIQPQAFQSKTSEPADGEVQQLDLDDELTTIALAGGPKKSINGGNLEDLMDHLHRDGEAWGVTNLSVAFPQSINDLPDIWKANYQQPEANGLDAFVAFDSDRISNAIKALTHWSNLTELHFTLADPGEQAHIYFMGREYVSEDLAGRSTGVDEVNSSVVLLNTNGNAWDTTNPGQSGYRTLLHEVGHSIGFDHPGDYDFGDNAKYDTHAEYYQDSKQYSIMSYFSTTETGASLGDTEIVTARTHDIWVAQKIYGAEWSTRTANTTYGYNASAETQGTVYEFWPGLDAPHLTIWDAGGTDDWLDLSLDANDVVLNLNPGTFSSTHGAHMNLSLAYGPDEATPAGKNYLIENAKGGFGNDYLIGNSADNVLDGNHGNDFMLGGHGNDTLLGAWGADTLWGGFGLDFFDGGDDFDIVDFTHSDVDWEFILNNYTHGTASNQFGTEELHNIEGIVGSNGDDLMVGNNQANLLDGRDGNDTIEGMSGDDTLLGGDGHDQMFGGFGENELDGGNGVDTLFYKFSTGEWDIDMMTGIATNQYGDVDTFENFERVIGGDDEDVIAGDTANNQLYGWDGDDHLLGRAGVDLLYGEEGNDTLTGGPGDDIMIGGVGIDTVRYQFDVSAVTIDLLNAGAQNTGGSGWDTIQEVENIIGSAWDDFLLGNHEANRIEGGSGDDQLFGRNGNDVLRGENGNDILEGGLGDDMIFGGDGEDAVSYYFSAKGVYVDLAPEGPYNTVNAGLDTYSSIENIFGSFLDDGLYGDDGNNQIVAGYGDDYVNGRAGSDDLFGGHGDDTLIGGSSNDFIDGGDGVDWARYDGAGDLTVDLADKTEQWTGAGTDKLINIENLRGWTGDDDLRGDNANNEIQGLSGDDTLYGGGGEDTLNGGSGNDIIYAGLDVPQKPADDFQMNPNPNGEPFGRGGGNTKALANNSGSGGFDVAPEEIGSYTGLLDDGIIDTGIRIETQTLIGNGGGGTRQFNPIDDKAQLPGSGPDVIVFSGIWGDDEVFDYTPGADKLDFSNAVNVDEMADLSINDTNDGVLITNGNNSVLLHDVEQADLSDSDFWF